MQTLAIGTAGQVLTVNAGATAPQWSAGTFTLAGDTGTETITLGDTLTVTGGEGITTAVAATDTVTLTLNIDELTAETTLDGTNDFVAVYDASATANRKVSIDNLLAGYGYAETWTPTASVAQTITHNLNTLDVIVNVVDVATGAEVITDVVRNGVNTIQVTSSTTDQLRVLIYKVL